jgi:hypothetical protein
VHRQASLGRTVLPIQIDGASAAGADAASEFGSGQADAVANGPQKRHLRVGVDGVLDAIILIFGMGFSLGRGYGVRLTSSSIEIGDDIPPIDLTGKIDENLGPVDKASRVREKFVEIGAVLRHAAFFIAAEKSNPGTVPLLLPTTPASDGPN